MNLNQPPNLNQMILGIIREAESIEKDLIHIRLKFCREYNALRDRGIRLNERLAKLEAMLP